MNGSPVLLSCLLLYWFRGTLALNYYRESQLATQLRSGLEKGTVLGPLQGVDYSDSPKTLLIALNTSCQYCAVSAPFHNRLAQVVQAKNPSVRVFAVFPNTAGEVQHYVEQNKLGLATIAGVDFRTVGVAGTPTIILLDSHGRVIDFWIGKLSEDAEKQVTYQLTS